MRLLLVVLGLGVACVKPNPAFVGQAVVDAPTAPDARADTAVPSDLPVDPAPPAEAPTADAVKEAPTADAATEAPAADAVPASALLGYWTFEEARGVDQVLDVSGNGHHGTLENLNATADRVPGKRGMALSFPAGATNPGAVVPVASSPIRTLQRFTVAAWVFRTQQPADEERSIVSRQIGTGPRQVFNLGFVDDELVLNLSQPSGSDPFTLTSGTVKTAINTWIHTAATWDGSELVLYLDGQRVAGMTRSWTLPDVSNPLYLGTNKNSNNDEPLVGLLDEVRLYNIALTPGQITALASDRVP